MQPHLQCTSSDMYTTSTRMEFSSSTEGTAFNPPPFLQPTGPSTILESSASPLDFLLLLFDGDVLIVEQTNSYATQNPPSVRYRWHDTGERLSSLARCIPAASCPFSPFSVVAEGEDRALDG